MTSKRALVIGCKLPPLEGTDNDAAAMTALLDRQQFTVETLTGTAASRAGILAAYDRLIADVDRDGTAVFYYAGHGGYAVYPDAAAGQRSEIQCIFPTDWTAAGETDAGAFRAILDVELSDRLRRLTDKTHNVTVILDCCHSSGMVRGPEPDPDLVPRVYGSRWARLAPAFLAANPIDLSRLDIESNPHAVRVVATAPDRQAFEDSVPSGNGSVRRGLFTATLERVLAECDRTPLGWQAIVARVRELVLQRTADQTPSVEGPADRLPFSMQVLKRRDAVVFAYDGKVPCLRANRILGAVVGAEYDIMPVGTAEHGPDSVVAHATVVELVGPNAHVKLALRSPDRKPEPGALAFPTTLPYPPLPVAVSGAAAAGLVAEIRTPPVDRPRRLEVVADARDARFSVTADGASLSTTAGGVPARIPLDDTEAGRALLLQWLERWSKADALHTLTGEGVPPTAIEVRWGRVEEGRAIPHGPGAGMHLGEWIYVTVTNRWDAPLHVAIFDIGIGGMVTLLTKRTPYGRPLVAGQSTTLGRRDGDAPLAGHGPIGWADDVPRTLPDRDGVPQPAPRRESLVVIAASGETDFRRLTTEALPARDRGLGRLEAVLDGFRDGRTRDFGGEDGIEGFCVRVIDFDLSPAPRAAPAAGAGAQSGPSSPDATNAAQ